MMAKNQLPAGHPGADYRRRLPALLTDTFTGPDGEPCAATTDRRWLWRSLHQLMDQAMTAAHQQVYSDLHAYLLETCEHHWIRSFLSPPGSQVGVPADVCVWCSTVKQAAE